MRLRGVLVALAPLGALEETRSNEVVGDVFLFFGSMNNIQ